MTVRIIIERSTESDQQDEALALLRELRAKAVLQPGYVSGETLTSVDKPGTHLVISTWRSLHDWRMWENHPERLEIVAKIDELLVTPYKVGMFTESWPSLPEAV